MRRSKREELRHRQQTADALHDSLWGAQRLGRAREAIFHGYTDTMAALIERRITDRDVAVSADEASLMAEIDAWLDAAEYALYAAQDAGLSVAQTAALWGRADAISERDEYAALRQYIYCGQWPKLQTRFINERLSLAWPHDLTPYGAIAANGQMVDLLAEHLGHMTGRPERGAVAGRLYRTVPPSGREHHPGAAGAALEIAAPVAARMLAQGSGSARSETVQVEVFPVVDPAVFATVDEWAGYVPQAPQQSPYRRRMVALTEPAGYDAWLYVGAHEPAQRSYFDADDPRTVAEGAETA